MYQCASVPEHEKSSGIQSNSDSSDWKAQLNCIFEKGPDRTTVRRNHFGPLTIQRPYYPEGDTAHVYMLHPPGGVVAGDRLVVDVQSQRESHALVSTPGATKFYRSEGRAAEFIQNLNSDGGTLEWFPQENIFFDGCNVRLSTRIAIANDAPLAWWEINCFGRRRADAPFKSGSVENTVQLRIGNKLLLKERLIVNDQLPIETTCGMRGCTVTASLILSPLHSEMIEGVRETIRDTEGFSATTFDNILMVRYLGDSSEKAKSGFIKAWCSLRLALTGKSPQMPRIWAT